MNSPTTPFYRKRLQLELTARLSRNENYSIRAFARSMKLDAGSLSQILNGKRSISKKVAEKILSQLEISTDEREQFLESIVEEKRALGIKKVNRSLKSSFAPHSNELGKPFRKLDSTRFAVIADWYHYAILEMTFKKDFKLEARWIAAKLGISRSQAKVAIERLLSLGLIKQSRGRWKKAEAHLDTLDKTKTSFFHRQRIRQILDKSTFSLENDPIEIRNHVGTTFCADPARIPEAKKMVQKFLWDLTAFLAGPHPSRVYEFSMQLFPLEKEIP